ncbi:MAG: Cyclohexanecarboxylate-CoA ligase [Ilumatobacteraceae bacterium]|nr:Cyclohexanecarboxylate-CoA ligase [Ilumatobacteraceae bacterium]
MTLEPGTPDIAMPETLWELVETAAARWPHDPILVSRQGDGCTYGEFAARAVAMAAGLDRLGVGEGDVVSWILPTWVDTVVLAAALSRLGVVQNPIIGINRDREVEFCVRESGSTWLLTPAEFAGYDFAAMGARVAAVVDGLRHVVMEPGAFPTAPVDPARDLVRGDARRVAWLCYTSGTTAAPKGARHADATVGSFSAAMAARMDVAHGDRYALVFPFPHIGGIGLLFLALRTGCTHLLDAVVDPVATVDFLSAHDCTHAGTGPAFFNMFLAAQAKRTEPIFPHLKACPTGGAPTPAVYHQRIAAELGSILVPAWGLTEAPVLTSGSLDDPLDKRMGTEGRPLPDVEIRVVAADGTVLPPGTPGEVLVRGPQVMLGYQDSTLDAQAFDPDRFYRTGDLGFVDADGYIVITGRLKDIIIRNGENISVLDVENMLHDVAGISEAAIVGLPDDRTGESVCAVVVPTRADVTLEDICASLTAAGLRRNALPTRLATRPVLPRSPAGKVLKNQLIAELLAGG